MFLLSYNRKCLQVWIHVYKNLHQYCKDKDLKKSYYFEITIIPETVCWSIRREATVQTQC